MTIIAKENESDKRGGVEILPEDKEEMIDMTQKAEQEKRLARVSEDLPDDEILYDLAELFKVFGDSTRIKILYALFESELCVCDIAQLLNLSQSAVSHQLRVLKSGKLVKFRRDGKTIYYSLADDHVVSIIGQGMDHVAE